jgi:hypothetical protein
MTRNLRFWVVIGMVVAFAIVGAGWKWTASGHKPSGTQLAGWSWDGIQTSSAQALGPALGPN